MKVYQTSDIAALIGIHPNTVRLYEEWAFITTPKRKPNGYRIFTVEHLEQIRLARIALRSGLVPGGLRKKALDVIYSCGRKNYPEALKLAAEYEQMVHKEIDRAEEAIQITDELLSKQEMPLPPMSLTRKAAAEYLEVTIDSLRNWELNGLLQIKRKENGYRVYDAADIRRMKIIRTLRGANYSLNSILRMLNSLEQDQDTDIRSVIDSPDDSMDIYYVCDTLLTALHALTEDIKEMKQQLRAMQEQFSGSSGKEDPANEN